MGEVYELRDPRLDRTDAINILPKALARDPQFRERSDREARWKHATIIDNGAAVR